MVKAILQEYDVRPKKRLGQSFLCDERVAGRIIEALEIDEGGVVLEVGPGLGILTVELVKRAGRVVTVEIDPRLADVLKGELVGYDNFHLIEGDILRVDFEQVRIYSGADRLKLIGNLPYQITSPLIYHLIEQKSAVERAVVMVQKEVARRMVALPGGKDYGALSVFVQYHTAPSLMFDVPAEAFYPKPKVDSSVVKLEVLKEPLVPVKDERLFFQMVRAAFGHRRKMLRNALSSRLNLLDSDLNKVASLSKIDLNRRGETLSIAEFGRLSDATWETKSETAKACFYNVASSPGVKWKGGSWYTTSSPSAKP